MPGGFSCKQCGLHDQPARCRGCAQFLTTDPLIIDQHLNSPPVPETPLRWATAFAHWGDTFAALSQAHWILQQKGGKRCSLIHCGHDAAIGEFCRAQPWIDRVIQVCPEDHLKLYALACDRDSEAGAYVPRLAKVAAEAGIPDFPAVREITPTHLISVTARNYRVHPLPGAVLPKPRTAWARKWWEAHTRHVPKPQRVFLLHPASTWSQNLAGHWPHWPEAVDWLLDETPHTYVLTGQERVITREHSRLSDLTGATPTNMEVLALCQLAAGVISTCNNLALWTVIQGLPGLIAGNNAIRNHAVYFRRFIEQPPNAFLPVEGTLDDWIALAAPWLRDPAGWAARARTRWDAERPRPSQVVAARTAAAEVRDEARYVVVAAIVAGKRTDFSRGATVKASDLNGPARDYLERGAIRSADGMPWS